MKLLPESNEWALRKLVRSFVGRSLMFLIVIGMILSALSHRLIGTNVGILGLGGIFIFVGLQEWWFLSRWKAKLVARNPYWWRHNRIAAATLVLMGVVGVLAGLYGLIQTAMRWVFP